MWKLTKNYPKATICVQGGEVFSHNISSKIWLFCFEIKGNYNKKYTFKVKNLPKICQKVTLLLCGGSSTIES